MKLKQASKKEKIVRLNLGVKESTDELLTAYQNAYLAQYGHEIERSALVELILLDFIRADKEFMKSLDEAPQKPAGAPAGAPATAQGKPTDTSAA
ncbi:DUF2274 domain-containing protein [Burkholderia cenocepacia]|uniref:DUF2274 domain-containing protein n=1 Tax=Burkholderia cenocepacia TaxID=95486 RepID=UPI0007611FD1|nr:DUF2274 domain-containing protein [Burkholderia cenocepacia]KWU17886.1 hypothetical protein AS149_14515 [Burkholderia cenocepacia]